MAVAVFLLLLFLCGCNTQELNNQTNSTNHDLPQSLENLLNFNKTLIENQLKNILVSQKENSSEVLNIFETNLSAQFARFKKNTKLQLDGVELQVVQVGLPSDERASGGDGMQNVSFSEDRSSVSLFVEPIRKRDFKQIKAVIVKWTKLDLHREIRQSRRCNSITCSGRQPVNASLITVTYYDVTNRINPRRLGLPVNYSMDTSGDFSGLLPPFKQVLSVERSCVWWDNNHWSTEGCKTLLSGGGGVQCACNHTTSFSTLLLLQTYDIPTWVTVASQVLQIVTIFFLALAVTLLLIARASKGLDGSAYYCVGMRNNRTVSQVSLCVSLIGLHATTLAAHLAIHSTPGCYTMAVLQHIFLLASAFWLLNEGIAITLKTHVDLALTMNYKLLTVCQVAAAWITPIAIVVASLAIFRDNYLQVSPAYFDFLKKDTSKYKNYTGFDTYPKFSNCWVNGRKNSSAIYMAIVPVAVTVGINLCLIARMVFLVYRISKEENSRQTNVTSPTTTCHTMTQQFERRAHWKSVCKSYCVLFPISTLPWLFWLISNVNVAFVGLHTVVNGAQGLGVFMVFCVFAEDDRKRLLRIWKRGRQHYCMGVSLKPSGKCGGHKTKTPHERKRSNGGRGSNVTVITNMSSS
uniref:Adhesion G protein-coupled receptor E3-like n=1 Tax=Phallusia mammillata TaxID=59560 RepID=A0A6F9D5C9_9ASCI|nr:adhesion G protein-coupled receptor E3-like [Phallusia mammillata]